MRNRFEAQLELLNNELISMGALCESAISCAVRALMSGDMSFAEQAIQQEKEINQKEQDIETLCTRLLVLQQPVARDLRMISAAMKMVTDMERIGDQSADIAEIAEYIKDFDSKQQVHISDMAQAVIRMVCESVDAFVKRDQQAAEAIIRYDDIVDDLFAQVRNDLIQMLAADAGSGEVVLDLLMIAKYLERIGDHATNIAETIIQFTPFKRED